MEKSNNEYTAKPLDLLRLSVLSKRNEILEGIEIYTLSGEKERHFETLVLPKIKTLYLQIRGEFDLNNKENFNKIIKSEDIGKILDFYYKMDNWLYSKKILTLTTQRKVE